MTEKWKQRRKILNVDSSTVSGWLKSVLSGESRIKSKSQSELIIRRKLNILLEIVKDYNFQVKFNLIKSKDNKVDQGVA